MEDHGPELATNCNERERERLILAGLYLSKYDLLGLKKLGFESFKEAFNVIGYAMGSPVHKELP